MLNYAIAPASSRKRTGVSARIGALAMWAGKAAHRWYRRRLTIYKLRELDDRTLKDIGLDRSEIDSVAHTGRYDRHRSYINYDLYRNGR